MIASLKERNNQWYCSKCMMRQSKLRNTCSFCGSTFSNLENVLYKIMKEREDEKTMLDYYDDFDYNDIYRVR